MAANNYYGIPVHGQPAQYSASATAYPTAPAGYAAVGHATAASAASTFAAQRAAQPVAAQAAPAAYAYPQAAAPAYSASPASTNLVAATANTYTYPAQYAAVTAAQPLQSAPPTGVPASAYYQQPSTVAVTYTAIDSAYQNRPTYTQAHLQQIHQQAAIAARPAVPTTRPVTYSTGAAAYTYAPSTTPSYSYPASQIHSSVTAAAKPNIYVQPQQATTINLTPVPMGGPPKLGQPWRSAKPMNAAVGHAVAARVFKGNRIPPKPQQLHYCEVCKISCAGPQTYKEHLEGQKHKKKEASMKTGTSGPTTRGGNALRCELCDVTCTGSDAYAAHIRGAKHQKVVKLHTKLGKPIPSVDPVLVTKGTTSTTATTTSSAPQTITNIAKAPSYAGPRQPAIPKITFVGSDKAKQETTVKLENKHQPPKPYIAEQEVTIPRLPEEKDVQPVGHDYIEEIKNEEGKVVSFNCKLCECRFNDPNAKEMHMKGRRHRLQFKKKVNPDLVVDIKPSLRQRKMQEERVKRSQAREEFWKRREEEFRAMEDEERVYWDERRRFEEEMDYFDWYRRFPGRGPVPGGPGGPPGGRFGPNGGGPPGPYPPFPIHRRPDTVDDRHCMAKHALIYPSEDDLGAIQKIVAHCEKALKLVSDHLAAQDSGAVDKKHPKMIKKEEPKDADGKGEPVRVLKGVMRVGVLAKGLLLTGDNTVRLVCLVGEKPTKSLLERIINNLPSQLVAVAPEDSYEVKRIIEDASLVISTPDSSDLKLTVTITLTSPLMRETEEEAANLTNRDPPDVLDHDKCLTALAELRHAKWFQARAAGRQSCVIVIRILRDLCSRVPTWSPIACWALELLVEKVLSSAGVPLSPGDALRRVFEALAGGILLPDSPGFLDPCEKEPTDAAFELTNQEREDITASAQHALRLIAFRQVHKVLGIDALPPPKQWRFARKRRRDSSTADSTEGDSVEVGKKDKKDVKED